MVLCHLMEKTGVNFRLAHCNFGLRGEESDGDEDFIRNYAEEKELELFVKSFDTESYSQKHKMGIQESARKLRYSWFRELSAEHGFTSIATAHHMDDQAETVLMNFIRGTGAQGLGGIYPKRKDLIRPLLFASKKEIIAYAQDNEIAFREDSSNESLKYRRNQIRHELLPALEQINPSIMSTLSQMSLVFRETQAFIQERIKNDIEEACSQEDYKILIPIHWLVESSYPRLLLWEIISPFGFSSAQLEDILELTSSQSGRKISNQEYMVSVNRGNLVVARNLEIEYPSFVIHSILDFDNIPNLSAEIIEVSEVDFDIGKHVAYVDLEKVIYPLSWRPWKAGDSMKPLGMKGSQKISDILVQRKIPLNEKSSCYVLESNDKIIWLAGLRFAEAYKINWSTNKVLKLQYNVGNLLGEL